MQSVRVFVIYIVEVDTRAVVASRGVDVLGVGIRDWNGRTCSARGVPPRNRWL